MKYWNKRREVRERCWHKVIVTPILGTGFSSPKEGKITLQRVNNNGKFYIEYDSKRQGLYVMQGDKIAVWFERKEDATWFALKYA